MAESVDLVRLIHSSSAADNVEILTMIRENPPIYTTIAPHLHALFTRSLLNAADASLRSIASQAFLVLARHVGRIRDVATINALFTPLTRYLISCEQDLPSEREDDGSTLLILSGLAGALPQALVPHLAVIISFCLQTVTSTDNAPSSRQRALGLLKSLSANATETIPESSLPAIVDSCLLMMSSIEWGAEEWMRGTEANIMGEAKLGKDCLTRIVFNLHERRIVPVILAQTGQFLLDEDWKCRLAGVMGLEVIGTTGLIVMIDQIANSLSSVLKDPDAIVRGAACQVLALISRNCGSNPTFLQDIVPLLVNSMADKSVPRVASKAADALYSFCRFSPQYIPGNLDAIISSIAVNIEEMASMRTTDLWRDRLICIQLHVVVDLAYASIGVGSPAESILKIIRITPPRTSLRLTTEQFAVIYDRLIASLKMLVSKQRFTMVAFDYISQVAIAVGKKKFAADAPVVLQACSARMDLSTGDESKSLLLSLRRLVLAEYCAPFLPLIIPSLTRVARCPAFVTRSSLDEWKVVEQNSQRAADSILDLATQHQAAFAPYAMDVVKVFCYNMKTSKVSKRFPILLSCVKRQGVRALWVPFLSALRELVKSGEKKSQFDSLLGILGDCVEQLDPKGLSTDEVREIGAIIKDMWEKKPENDMIETPKGPVYTDDPLVMNIATIICSLFEKAGANSFQVVHSLAPLILSSMMNKLCEMRIVSHYLRHAPQLAYIHHTPIAALLLSSISDNHPDTRMYSAIAIGSLAQSQCLLWAPFVARSIPFLHAAISRRVARSNNQWPPTTGNKATIATEHAISAAAKIISHCEDMDDTPLLASFVEWINAHGIWEDIDELQIVYGVLLDLVQWKHPLIIGENEKNWPTILRILIKTLTYHIFKREGMAVKRRMISTIEKLAAEPLFKDHVVRAWLNEVETKMLNKILSHSPIKAQL